MDIAAIQAKEIRDYYKRSYGRVNPPASEKDILRAEKKIGKPLPRMLKELYHLCNGFFNDVDEPVLMPLDMVVAKSKQFRGGIAPDLGKDYIIFGYFTGWKYLMIKAYKGGTTSIVSFNPNTNEEFRDQGPDLLTLYQNIERWLHSEVLQDTATWGDEWNPDRKKKKKKK